MRSYQVVVVGGGPVGVGLAVELGLRGVSCAVIERRDRLSSIPKGQGLQQRTMEHFYFWGIEKELRAARTMTHGHPIGNIAAYWDLMSDVWVAPPGREVVSSYYFQANERLPQYKTEEVLRRRMADFPNVENYFGWLATDLDVDEDRARVTVERNDVREVLEAEYVVGCDGGHSMVRELADIERSGSNFDEVMALVVFRSKEFHRALERFPPRSTYRVVHPDLKGYWQFFGRIDVGEGFFFHAPVPRGMDMEDVDVASLLYAAAGLEFPFEVDHFGLWDLRVQVSETYRAGRAFIAGDAAHTHPPYGGFGLNNGLEDAVNLGWKLEAVLDGWGGDALLDSYSLERQPVFHDIGEKIIAAGIRHERNFLEQHSPRSDGARFKDLFTSHASGTFDTIRSYEPHYDGSPVVCGPPGGATSAIGEHRFAAAAGHHLAPQPLSWGRNVYEELGPGFTLLAFGADDSEVVGFEKAAAELRVPLETVRDSFADERSAYAARMILVRPDQFIAWTGDQAPSDVEAVLTRVVGRAGPPCS